MLVIEERGASKQSVWAYKYLGLALLVGTRSLIFCGRGTQSDLVGSAHFFEFKSELAGPKYRLSNENLGRQSANQPYSPWIVNWTINRLASQQHASTHKFGKPNAWNIKMKRGQRPYKPGRTAAVSRDMGKFIHVCQSHGWWVWHFASCSSSQ